MKTGKFITFEGGEGGGKSTLIRALNQKLIDHNIDTILTREPGGSKGAEEIRQLILQGDVDRWDFLSETFLLFAGRRDHIVKTIWPAMEQKKWVLCDRFYDSTLVYQGHTKPLPDHFTLDDFAALARMSFGDFRPDLTILVDIPAEIGVKRSLNRMSGDAQKEDRFEMKDMSYHERVRQAYLELAKKEPERFIVIDGQKTAEAMQEEAWQRLCVFFDMSEVIS